MNWAGVKFRSGLSGAVGSGLSCMMFPFLGRTNVDSARKPLRFWADHADDQHAVLHHGSLYLNAVGQQEAPLKLPGGNAAVQEFTAGIVVLPAAHDQLIVFLGELELGLGKTSH